MCSSVGVADRNIIPDSRMTASTFLLLIIIIHTTADCMKTGEKEGGVPRLHLTEHTIYKLIWVQCALFVLWPHKD